LQTARVAGRRGYVVRHQEVGVPHLFICLDGFDQIDVTTVRVGLHKLVAVPADVTEMHVENLLARAEITDHVVDFLARLVQHLRHRALAEVEPVVTALSSASGMI